MKHQFTVTIDTTKAPSPDTGDRIAQNIRDGIEQHLKFRPKMLNNGVTTEVSPLSTAEETKPCILTGAPGENPDDCTTHAHEPHN